MQNPDVLRTLFHPFAAGAVSIPSPADRALLVGAPGGLRLPDGWKAQTRLVQPFRPDFLALLAAGHDVSPRMEGEHHQLSLVLAGRHRGLNEARIADAWQRTASGGTILVAGGKEDGIDSLRKRLADRLEGKLSKHHGVAFWLRRDDGGTPFAGAGAPAVVEGQWQTAPGMFSFDRVDAGSRLLAEHLPDDLAGHIADFGAGWGYLADIVAGKARRLDALDLYEADHAALDAARANLARLQPDAPAAFHWRDLTTEQPERRYDAIVMNPPFHAGRAAEPLLGAAFVAAASRALKPRGRLFLVANRGLPYEKALAAGFASSEEIARDATYKVIAARR